MALFIPKNYAFYLSLFCVKYRVLQSVSRLFTILYSGADKSLARATSRCILFDGENISFEASLVIYIYIVLARQYAMVCRWRTGICNYFNP
jgi:hypothetical protein